MAVTESFIEYKRIDNKAKTSKGYPSRNFSESEGDEDEGIRRKERHGKPPTGKEGKDKAKYQFKDKGKFKPKTNCFLCDGPHWARDSPRRQALNAMIEEREKVETS